MKSVGLVYTGSHRVSTLAEMMSGMSRVDTSLIPIPALQGPQVILALWQFYSSFNSRYIYLPYTREKSVLDFFKYQRTP